MSPWYRLHLQAWAHDTHYTFKHEHKRQITPSGIGYCFARSVKIFKGTISSWRRPLYNSNLQLHGHYTHYTFNLMSVIHNTPSTAWPLYTLHLQPHGHYTHYTFNRMAIIHITPSTACPLYTLHLQPHVHYTQFTFNQMAIINISPSTTWSLYNNHLWTHGHYTHVPSNRWPLYTRTVGKKRPRSTLPP